MHTAGFSKNGREWIANAVVSSSIGVLTFVVYASMTNPNPNPYPNPNPDPNPDPNQVTGALTVQSMFRGNRDRELTEAYFNRVA